MKIEIQRGSSGHSMVPGKSFKKSTLRITRSDGSKDWGYIHPGLQDHDIAHYAVETVLGMKNGFYGIIDQGASIADFELPKNQKGPLVHPDTMHLEAIHSEYLVNQLQTEIWSSGLMEDFLDIFKKTLADKNIPYPKHLNAKSLEEIRKVYHHHALAFHAMKEGEVLRLIMDIK
jgi:hypothetical protein